MAAPVRPVGDLLREWRLRRRYSQLELAIEADVSARHISFVETGRSLPSGWSGGPQVVRVAGVGQRSSRSWRIRIEGTPRFCSLLTVRCTIGAGPAT